MSDAIKFAADELAAHVRTCRMSNSLDWMEQLAERLNAFYASIGSRDRVETFGNSLNEVNPFPIGANLPSPFGPFRTDDASESEKKDDDNDD